MGLTSMQLFLKLRNFFNFFLNIWWERTGAEAGAGGEIFEKLEPEPHKI
jgi:hypothetical protein